ncbi:hypothetical protein F8S13_18740 [Chloroflexia bacterium SDU3-3]|nr:hypothetical protein F8S13_18740 [Chloroflexia bacterium SDU3-3]
MWMIARYLSTSLFSLRPALATASGAQSLLVPTAYAIKMALADVACRRYGAAAGAAWWPQIQALQVALDVPPVLVLNKTFIKIQRPTRLKKSDEQEVAAAKAEGVFPMGPTIAFREFVQFGGELGVALGGAADLPLAELLPQINYFGKRGSFFQIQDLPAQADALDGRWTPISQPSASFPRNGTLQVLDDCGPGLSWEHVNVFTTKSIGLGGKDRLLHTVVLPYELRRSSYRYTLYQRIAQEEP